MDRIQRHFEEEADEFDGIILRLIPYYPEMLEALVSTLPFEASRPIRVTDLGCGTGTVAARVKAAFPNALVTCVDIAANMLEMAKKKLAGEPGVRFVQAGFNHFDFDAGQDAVVSSLALHHLVSDGDKRDFYRKIHDSLAPGGVFYNADVVLAANDGLQKTAMEKWKAFMLKSVSRDEIEGKWLPKYYEEDRPARLKDQLKWLEEIGFADVDVIWKTYNYAVYGGSKPEGRN
ncbi:class I SAM-dependent methyltransferase [bacterium]|nr:class I SAM-dependent methyltransferase [bacterium]